MHHSAGLRDRSECDRNEAPMRCRSGGEDQRSRASHVHIRASWACSVLSCARVGARAGNKREVCMEGHIRESSKKRTIAREVAKVEALYRESMLETESSRQRVGWIAQAEALIAATVWW